MQPLTLGLFGRVAVTRAGRPVTGFTSVKVRTLLAYLAVEADRAHSRDALAALLWPDLPEETARAYVRHALANLRAVLGDAAPPYLLIDHESALQLGQCLTLDVADFQALLAACAHHPHRRAATSPASAALPFSRSRREISRSFIVHLLDDVSRR